VVVLHTSPRRIRPAGVLVALLAVPAALLVGVGPAQAATSRYVAVNDPACSDSGTGTQARPFCSIVRAAEVAVAGDTVVVSGGTYVGEVVPVNSGTSSAPITYRAATNENVVVTGGNRGFSVRSKSWITISGFQVTGTVDNGIYLKSATGITVSGNRVSFVGQPGSSSTTAQGIYLTGTKDSSLINNVTDHNSDTGIYVTTGNSGIDIRGNTSFANARGYTRAATGIDVRSPGNTVAKNVSYENEDSGIQLYNGANGTQVYGNLVYRNGDHGIDVLNSTDTVIVSNTVFENVTAGINLEGATGTAASSRGTLRNNISIDNGLGSTSTRGNVRVDASSLTGTTIDSDLVHLRISGTMFTWGTSFYSSVAALRTATGQETRGLEADPRWVAPSFGDFRLLAGSPAIDSADSGAPSQPLTDLAGAPRVDDPAMPNTGVGPRAFDDRGALEHKPVPVAVLSVTPSSGEAPLLVSADASGSSSPIGIASYAFDFGDGSAGTGPQTSASTSHSYPQVGTYTMTVTVTDTDGQSSTATAQVRARAPDEPPTAVLSVTPRSGAAPLAVTADASGSTDPDATPIDSYTFDFGDGTVVGPQPAATATHTYPAVGSFPVTVTVTDTAGNSATASDTVTVNDPNLVGNPGFETSTSGWNVSGRAGITLTRVAGGHTGSWAGQLTNTTTTTQADCTLNDAPNWIASTKAGTYRASLWVRSDTAGQVVRMRLREYNGSVFVASSPIVTATLGTTWTQLTVDITPQILGSTLDLTAYVTNAAPGPCFTADDISITLR
jgi:parallel beta-helix repeat protein